jgi:PEP-CTERM motif-containing protein
MHEKCKKLHFRPHQYRITSPIINDLHFGAGNAIVKISLLWARVHSSKRIGGATLKSRFSTLFLLLMFCVSVASFANADDIQTIGQFTGSTCNADPCTPTIFTIGTFNINPGDTSITISGFFGNSVAPNSAGANVYLGSILVAQCVEFAGCYSNQSPTAWSDTLTLAQISALGTGPVNLTATQTSQFVVQLGETTLDQVATPEPSSIFLLGTSLLGLGGAVRRKILG